MLARTALILSILALTLPCTTQARTAFVDSTDIQINKTAPVDEREGSVFVSPVDPNVVLVANNGGAASDPSAWISTNAGSTWTSNSTFDGKGDPAVVISGSPAYEPLVGS